MIKKCFKSCYLQTHYFFVDILRQFNPEVRGFSTGSGNANSAGARYNVAVAGAIAQWV